MAGRTPLISSSRLLPSAEMVSTHKTRIFMWVLGAKLRSSCFTLSTFLTEPSPQPKLGTFQLKLLCLTWLSLSVCDNIQSMSLTHNPAWKTYMEFSFPQYRIFPLSSPTQPQLHLLRSCEVQIVTKITNGCNIWKPKQTQERSGGREEPRKQETQRGERKKESKTSGLDLRPERRSERGVMSSSTPSPSESTENYQ